MNFRIIFFFGPLFVVFSFLTAQIENYTYKLTQSTNNLDIWTTTPSERVFKDDQVPEVIGSDVKVYIAKNEFEPFQVIVKPSSSEYIEVSINGLPSGLEVEIFRVDYVNIETASDVLGRIGDYPDPLFPVENGDYHSLIANENCSFWFNVSASNELFPGDYNLQVQIDGITIPINIHVFNFSIPETLHIHSQMNFNYNSILSKYSVSGYNDEYWMYVDKMKQFFIDHRLTPKASLWPGGLTSAGGAPLIDYDYNTRILSDPNNEWGFEDPAERYIEGSGNMNNIFDESFNNSTGFPSFMGSTFSNLDPSIDQRPSTFEGFTRSASDWLQNPNSLYNTAWFNYITDLETYLNSFGYLSKTYNYFVKDSFCCLLFLYLNISSCS